MGPEVAGYLDRVPEGTFLLPPLTELMARGELKRELWAALQERR